jgi:hypothetical protein
LHAREYDMAIEVRQLVIKSTVVKDDAAREAKHAPAQFDFQELKAEILAECRQAIAEALRERRER